VLPEGLPEALIRAFKVPAFALKPCIPRALVIPLFCVTFHRPVVRDS
jgi:hypothetical protein